jgi:hypothetical protein
LSRRLLGSEQCGGRNQGNACREKRNLERAFEIARGPVADQVAVRVAVARWSELTGCGFGMRRKVCAHGNRFYGRWQRPASLNGGAGRSKIDAASLY